MSPALPSVAYSLPRVKISSSLTLFFFLTPNSNCATRHHSFSSRDELKPAPKERRPPSDPSTLLCCSRACNPCIRVGGGLCMFWHTFLCHVKSYLAAQIVLWWGELTCNCQILAGSQTDRVKSVDEPADGLRMTLPCPGDVLRFGVSSAFAEQLGFLQTHEPLSVIGGDGGIWGVWHRNRTADMRHCDTKMFTGVHAWQSKEKDSYFRNFISRDHLE